MTQPKPIPVTNVLPLDQAAKRRLEGISDRLRITHRDREGDEWPIEQLVDPEVEVLLAYYPPSDLGRTPRLRWLQVPSSGVDYLDRRRLLDGGVTVTNASGIHAVPIAEYVIGMLLHVAKGVESRQANQRLHGWPAEQPELAGRLLRGRTMVIVGYGSIGREVARLAAAFGMRILAVKADAETRADAGYRYPGTGDPEGRYPERIAGPSELPALAAEADYLVTALPGIPGTRGLVGAAVVDAMRPEAWLVNVGRGASVDPAAVAAALRTGRLAGAVLDVFETEPLPPDSELWDLPGSIVTPHVSGGPAEVFDLLVDLLAQNLGRYAEGRPLLNVVDLARGY
jgi:phosphoglycerate dehydrogenase-like enzyme